MPPTAQTRHKAVRFLHPTVAQISAMLVVAVVASIACARPDRAALESVGNILRRSCREIIISRQKLRQAESIQLVRERRESGVQTLGFASRPFVLCGLPIKRPSPGVLLHERRNGHFVLQVTGHPGYGLSWGQDRLVPIFVAILAIRQKSQVITFRSAAEMFLPLLHG